MFLLNFIESTGNRVIKYSLFTYDFIIFLFKCLRNIFLPSNYCKASRIFLIKQIYLSAIKNLFPFIFLALFLGPIIIVIAISFAINFSLIEQIGDLLVLLVINEFSPFFTTLFFILAYSLLLKKSRLNRKTEKRSLPSKIYIPKLLIGLFIVPLMALLFATIMLVSGYIVSSLYLNIDFITYENLIINSISFENILILLIKASIFGFIAVLIPIYSEHLKKNKYDVSRFVIKNLIIILSMLIFVELLFILIIY